MLCSRCNKNEATAITPLAYRDKEMHGTLCEQCGTQMIEWLYSCTCDIEERGSNGNNS